MTKQPSYRFTGLEDDWKEVKLGEVFDIVTDYVANGSFESLRNNVKTYEKDNFAYMIRLQDASNSWKGPWLYTDEKGYNFLSKSRLFKDDILMSNVGTVGRFFQVPELDRPMTLAPNSVLIRSTSSNNQFLYFMMLTANIQDQIAMRKTPGVQDKINKTDFKKVIATLPSLLEQTAIGSFFQDIDQLISLQQRKLEVLKEQKKTYLKLLFPAKGQTKPALRFAGFEDEWKEVKVSDIFRVTRGQVLATTEISEEKTDTHKYPVYSSQTKNEGLLGYYDKYLFETAITWTTDGANAGTVNYREGKFYSTNVNGVLLSDEGFANKVVAEILNNEAWKYVSKVGNPKLMNNVMSEISLVIPNDFREISILSTFFQDLDKAIAKQEEKVNQLKESKQTLLRKMFI